MPHERTMREALLEAGWSPTFLRSDLREARIGLKDDEVVFEPWSRLSRLQRPSNVVTRLLKLYPHLPVHRVIWPDVGIRFDPALANSWMFLGLIDSPFLGSRNMLTASEVASQFPFGQQLIIKSLNSFTLGFNVSDPVAGKLWAISYIALTFLLEISIAITEYDLGLTDEWWEKHWCSQD